MACIGRAGWNDLRFCGAIPDDELIAALEESYRLVVARLPRRDRPAPSLVELVETYDERRATVSPTRRATTSAT